MPSRPMPFALAAAFVLALSGTATAQQATDSLRELDDDDTKLTYQGLTVDALDDMDVLNEAGEKIGEIDEVLANADDEIVAVVLDLDDGLFDLDDREVVMELDQLQLEQGATGNFVTTMTEDKLRALRTWGE